MKKGLSVINAWLLTHFRFIKKLKSFNQLLLTTLQECKNDMEWISMLLGQQESDSAALSLAVQYR